MPSKMDLEQDKAFRAVLSQALRTLVKMDTLLGEEMADGMRVNEIRVQGPNITGGGVRVIIKGAVDGQRFVAFHNAEDVRTVLSGLVDRAENGAMRWKDDLPYVPKGG